MFIRLYVCMIVSLPVRLYVCLSVSLSAFLPVCLSFYTPAVCSSVYPSVCLLIVCPSSVCMYVCPFVSLDLITAGHKKQQLQLYQKKLKINKERNEIYANLDFE